MVGFQRIFGGLLMLAALGCAGCIPKTPAARPIYTGPTEPMSLVVNAINQNNSRVPTLFGKGDFDAWIFDHGKRHPLNGTVTLQYRQPDELWLVAKKDVAGRVFEIGSNANVYWLIVRGDVDTMWWGSRDNSIELDPKEIPIQPDLLVEVLGVSTIDLNFRQPPVPVMRFNNDADAYMLTWTALLPDRWAAQKEVWYDRATKLPIKVLLFDVNGRVVLLADLSKHQAIDLGDGADGPKVATSYRLYFPDSGTTMSFDLSDLALTRGNLPNDKSFAFPGEQKAGVSKTIRIDQHAATP